MIPIINIIGNVSTSGVFQIWRTSDGAVIPVDYSGVTGSNAATYLSGWTNQQISSINY
ncbi:MAG: hypothetical protein CM15mV75_220 [uncultured marine virus]|nr:MAG: hypothetical protein CM15mV75_220 [uncultured marine virus]